MGREAILEAAGLRKTFAGTEGKIEVLKGLDLSVLCGEVVGIIGSSGVGKSTLLHILGTLDEPDAGSIKIKGHDALSLSRGELNLLRSDVIGFVFQFHYLLPDFTALENVMMPSLVGGRPWNQSRCSAERLLEAVGLSDRFLHKPSELSGGEHQRIAVARALMNDPELILADEPTGNLDERASNSLHELIRGLARDKGKTFVVVTHKREFSQFADRVLELKNGTLDRLEGNIGSFM